MHACVHACACTLRHVLHSRLTPFCISVYSTYMKPCSGLQMSSRTHVCMHTCTHANTHVYAHMYTLCAICKCLFSCAETGMCTNAYADIVSNFYSHVCARCWMSVQNVYTHLRLVYEHFRSHAYGHAQVHGGALCTYNNKEVAITDSTFADNSTVHVVNILYECAAVPDGRAVPWYLLLLCHRECLVATEVKEVACTPNLS